MLVLVRAVRSVVPCVQGLARRSPLTLGIVAWEGWV